MSGTQYECVPLAKDCITCKCVEAAGQLRAFSLRPECGRSAIPPKCLARPPNSAVRITCAPELPYVEPPEADDSGVDETVVPTDRWGAPPVQDAGASKKESTARPPP
jgi:hypothetical protein